MKEPDNIESNTDREDSPENGLGATSDAQNTIPEDLESQVIVKIGPSRSRSW